MLLIACPNFFLAANNPPPKAKTPPPTPAAIPAVSAVLKPVAAVIAVPAAVSTTDFLDSETSVVGCPLHGYILTV